MKILVTGSTGFIGGALCRELVAQGYEVRAFHRTTSNLRLLENLPVEHVIGDLTQPDSVRAAVEGVEGVFHVAAWVGMNDPGRLYAITVEGTRAVVQAALQCGVRRLVYTSSVAALGIPQPGIPSLLDEHHTWNFRPEFFPYGYAKYLAELEIQKAVAQGLDAVIVNPSLVLGPGDLYRHTSSVIMQIATRKVGIAVTGGANVVHVADVVEGHIAAFSRGKTGERYILGHAHGNLSMQQAFALLEQIANEAHTVIRLTALSSEKEPHSTMVALIVKKDYAIWAHAGDSRLYFFRAGRLVHRTEDQTYAAKLLADGKVSAAELATNKYKNILVSALGISREPKLMVGEASDLRVGDAFLLCSDGLWAYFEDHELASLLHSLAPREASEHLVRIARERAQGRGDNISLAIVKLEAPEPKKRAPTATLFFDDGKPTGGGVLQDD